MALSAHCCTGAQGTLVNDSGGDWRIWELLIERVMRAGNPKHISREGKGAEMRKRVVNLAKNHRHGE